MASGYLTFAVTLWLAAGAPVPGHWSQWRGTDGSGVSGETGLPAEWSPESARWKTALPGRGHSSPIVWGRRLFLTAELQGQVIPGAKAPKHFMNGEEFKHPDSVGADRSHTLKVICLDRDTGKILWERTAYEGPVYDDRHRKGSYASPTPRPTGATSMVTSERKGSIATTSTGGWSGKPCPAIWATPDEGFGALQDQSAVCSPPHPWPLSLAGARGTEVD